MASRPRRIKVGHLVYPVRYVQGVIAGEDGLKLCGQCRMKSGERGITISMDTGSDTAETLMHETLHALFMDRDIPACLIEGTDEHVVSLLSMGLVALLRENKDLCAAFVEGIG